MIPAGSVRDLVRKVFPHASPNLSEVADAIRPLMAAAGNHGFYVERASEGVAVLQVSWAGVDETAVAQAIAASPVDTPSVRDRRKADRIDPILKAGFDALLDLINIERAQHGRAAITNAQFIAAVKARL